MEQSKYPALFVTLTYADHSLPWTLDDKPLIKKHFGDEFDEVTLLTRDVQLFNMLLRQNNKINDKLCQYRYYAAGEYGGKHGRPHYHLIMFNVHPKTMDRIPSYWKYGRADVQLVHSQNKVSAYVSSYIVNGYSQALRINKRPFSLMSKKPYLGHTYVERMRDYHKTNLLPYLDRGTFKQALPRIFKQKIFEQWELNSMKLPASANYQEKYDNEILRLQTLNGYTFPEAVQHINDQSLYHHNRILENTKHADKYEYHLGNLDKAKALPHHARRRQTKMFVDQIPDRKSKGIKPTLRKGKK